IRDRNVTGVQTCALPIHLGRLDLGLVQGRAVGIAEQVLAVPGEHLEIPLTKQRCECRLDQRLARLAVGSREGYALTLGQLANGGSERRGRRREVDERRPARGWQASRSTADDVLVDFPEIECEGVE